MIVRFSAALVEDRLRALPRQLDLHASLAGSVVIYLGAMPATGGGAVGASVVLATLTFPKPSYGSFTGGVMALLLPSTVIAVATGVPTWARFLGGGGVYVMDTDVGNTASSAAVKVTNDAGGDTIYAGGNVVVSVAGMTET